MSRVHWIVLASLMSIVACRTEGADAYGNFEATEVTVSAEASGRVLRLAVEEGAQLDAMAEVGLIDTVPLALQRAELSARREAARSRLREVDANAAVLETQRVIAQRELERTQRLLAAQAATAQQGDRAEREARVLGEQLQGTAATRVTVGREVTSIEAQMATLDDRLRRSRIVTPAGGTVLAKFIEAGEFVQVGTPLFKVAALDTLTLRAYVSGGQLAQLALGQEVQVRVDSTGSGVRTVPGRVTWISSSAEFTPTPIQTREERTTQVYAIKVAVPNADGRLRLGMPGEVVLSPVAAAGAGESGKRK
jgi:HlyD family secretion protein